LDFGNQNIFIVNSATGRERAPTTPLVANHRKAIRN